MKLPRLDPDDRRWLFRWLRGNLVCVVLLLGLLLVLQIDTAVRMMPVSHADPSLSTSFGTTDDHRATTGETAVGISVQPEGWRRTVNGWEHVSNWHASAVPLEQVISGQRDREPYWVRALLAWLRSLSPVTYAAIQLATLIVAVAITEAQKQTRPSCRGRV